MFGVLYTRDGTLGVNLTEYRPDVQKKKCKQLTCQVVMSGKKVTRPAAKVREGYIKMLQDLDKSSIPMLDMEFPTLDEMEMEVPVLEQVFRQQRVSNPEYEDNVDLQCLRGMWPSLSVTALNL